MEEAEEGGGRASEFLKTIERWLRRIFGFEKRRRKEYYLKSRVYPKDLGYMDTIILEEWNEEDLKLFSKWEREGFVPEI